MKPLTPRKTIEKLKKLAGKQDTLARLSGVTQSAVSRWFTRGCIPVEHAWKLSKYFGVSLHELRPDIYPEE